MTICIHCKEPCRLTNGKEIYPHRPDLAAKKIWKCDECNATVGCHRGTTEALGYAANKQTRDARQTLHKERLDPIWKQAPKVKRRSIRVAVYAYLSDRMAIDREDTHVGMFNIDDCRKAWTALKDIDWQAIEAWKNEREIAA